MNSLCKLYRFKAIIPVLEIRFEMILLILILVNFTVGHSKNGIVYHMNYYNGKSFIIIGSEEIQSYLANI